MTKRLCDKCGAEIDLNAVYYLEEVRVMNSVVPVGTNLTVARRELCAACCPYALDPAIAAKVVSR